MHVPGGGLLLFGLLAVFFGALTAKYARRLVTVARMLRRGARTTGSCVRVEREPYNRSDATRHFFAFRTADGETVEFEDLAGWSMAKGTVVTVAYDPRDPARTATIAGRGNWSPVLQCLALVGGCSLGTAGFATLFLVQALGGT
ncbi:hypothetical protein GCM10018793_25410 [Streptomyces sulfonofaciens]|uniref:DUF3592 domain-containing protein n=1 Tax=Streptomyces sulfonofaciens TaxID=68272 RepID=A0A919G3E1_9ACTN|nr:DUF3592 domain-containing protein [Streptomyces sulfonofaciens]GHH77408.1 hypothetical protein GCM10018793_25410 [Streptomyces sulfonofaciens]